MDWLERMNGAIGLIEDHLTNELDLEKVARIACCSVYHFQRMFSFITDISLSEYIRRIRLHGLTPSAARAQGVNLKAYPRISFHISMRGDTEMNYKIETKEAFSVFGVERIFSQVGGENLRKIPQFWQEACENGVVERIGKASGCQSDDNTIGLMPVNAIMCYRDTGKDSFPYMLCAFTPKGGVPEGFTAVEVPSLLWAIFTTDKYSKSNTSQTIQALWKRIFSEWFPTSGYEHANAPELEMYYVGSDQMEYCEIWIPVVKK
jgi:AraC family transcriptional regulator